MQARYCAIPVCERSPVSGSRRPGRGLTISVAQSTNSWSPSGDGEKRPPANLTGAHSLALQTGIASKRRDAEVLKSRPVAELQTEKRVNEWAGEGAENEIGSPKRTQIRTHEWRIPPEWFSPTCYPRKEFRICLQMRACLIEYTPPRMHFEEAARQGEV